MNSIILLLLIVSATLVLSQEISSPGESTELEQVQRIFNEESEDHHEEDHHEHDQDRDNEDDVHVHEDHGTNYRTWLFASLALFVISLCGIFGVLIIPIMQKIFYQHLLQFLIALGI